MTLRECIKHGFYYGTSICPECGRTSWRAPWANDAIAGEAQRGETVKQGSTGTASTRARGPIGIAQTQSVISSIKGVIRYGV